MTESNEKELKEKIEIICWEAYNTAFYGDRLNSKKMALKILTLCRAHFGREFFEQIKPILFCTVLNCEGCINTRCKRERDDIKRILMGEVEG
jgi:hypothetical protein